MVGTTVDEHSLEPVHLPFLPDHAMKPTYFLRRNPLASGLGLLSGAAALLVAFTPDPAIPQAGGGGQQQPQGQTGAAENGLKGFWEIVLDGGRFTVRLDTISSVSQHQYIVDGARVYEVTVDTTGSQAARFYYLEPMTDGGPLTIAKTALDRAKEVAQGVTERTGTTDVWDQVIKTYPDTTHARTAEYRLQNRAVLTQIYNHVHKVWAQERGRGEKNLLRIVTGEG